MSQAEQIRKAILDKASERKREEVEVPEWDCTVTVQSLSALERERILGQMTSYDEDGEREIKLEHSSARLVVMSVIDPDTGARVFTDKDINALSNSDGGPIERITEVARRLSRLDAETKKRKADLKNSDEAQEEDS